MSRPCGGLYMCRIFACAERAGPRKNVCSVCEKNSMAAIVFSTKYGAATLGKNYKMNGSRRSVHNFLFTKCWMPYSFIRHTLLATQCTPVL